jgi:hypothetical protein
MSTAPPEATGQGFTSPGHPVRNASVVLALVVGLLVVAWAGGLVTPRVSIGGGGGSYDLATREGTLVPDVHNDALAGFEIQGAEIIAEGVTTVETALGVTPLSEHPTVASGETRPLVVHFEVADCGATPPAEWQLEITARTALGLTRTITVPAGHQGPSALCL